MKLHSINQSFNVKNYNIPAIKSFKVNNQYSKINNHINCYPKNYYLNQVSFGLKSNLSANELISKIGEENFPSPEILNRLRDIGVSHVYSLYDIHLEYYKDLLNCSTLDEAKQKYPEFQDVRDAKDIYYNPKNKQGAIYRIVNKQIPDIDIKDLSLELLKKQYGQLIFANKKENYYNFNSATVSDLFNLLNIKKMNNKYIGAVVKSSAQAKELASKHTSENWKKDNGQKREKVRKAAQKSVQTLQSEDIQEKSKKQEEVPNINNS